MTNPFLKVQIFCSCSANEHDAKSIIVIGLYPVIELKHLPKTWDHKNCMHVEYKNHIVCFSERMFMNLKAVIKLQFKTVI